MRRWICSVVGIGLLMSVGCGPEGIPGVVKVSGSVKLDGAPVEGAIVSFLPEGSSRAASGITDASGNFKLTTLNAGDGALPGNYKVTVSKVEDTDPAHQISAQEFTAAISSGGKVPVGQTRGQKGKNEGLKYHVPAKYMDAEKSGLTATVTAGSTNNIPIDLKN